jgi:hypothetical protein
LLVCITVGPALAGGTLKAGVDLLGDHKVSGFGVEIDDDIDASGSFSGEIFESVKERFDIGVGTNLQLKREAEDFRGYFHFHALYALLRARFGTEKIAPYAVGHLGYNFFYGDFDYKGVGFLTGGWYYGLGAGLIIKKHFLFEALYSRNNGNLNLLGAKFDIDYTKLTLNFGYNF